MSFNIFRRKSLGKRIVAQAKEQFPTFVVETGFGLAGMAIVEGSRYAIQKATEKKALPTQPQQQNQS